MAAGARRGDATLALTDTAPPHSTTPQEHWKYGGHKKPATRPFNLRFCEMLRPTATSSNGDRITLPVSALETLTNLDLLASLRRTVETSVDAPIELQSPLSSRAPSPIMVEDVKGMKVSWRS